MRNLDIRSLLTNGMSQGTSALNSPIGFNGLLSGFLQGAGQQLLEQVKSRPQQSAAPVTSDQSQQSAVPVISDQVPQTQQSDVPAISDQVSQTVSSVPETTVTEQTQPISQQQSQESQPVLQQQQQQPWWMTQNPLSASSMLSNALRGNRDIQTW